MNGLAVVPLTLLQAQNKPHTIARLHALELLPFVLLLSIAIYLFGLPGAATAWGLRAAADGGLMFRAAQLPTAVLTDLIAPGASLVIALTVAEAFHPQLLGALGWSAVISMIPLIWLFIRRDEIGLTIGNGAWADRLFLTRRSDPTE
jgi:hypothetical protein